MELKDVGVKRNSDLVECGVDEFEHYSEQNNEKKKAGRPKKEEVPFEEGGEEKTTE